MSPSWKTAAVEIWESKTSQCLTLKALWENKDFFFLNCQKFMDGKVECSFYFLSWAWAQLSAGQMTGTQPIRDCALQ